jgi:hypothetical protein
LTTGAKGREALDHSNLGTGFGEPVCGAGTGDGGAYDEDFEIGHSRAGDYNFGVD